MRYILVMSLSGSVMFLLYQLICKFTGEKIQIKARYAMLKAAVLYFMIPLPFLKVFYNRVLSLISEVFSGDRVPSVIYMYHDKSMILYDGERYYINSTMRAQIIFACVWMLFALVILALFMAKHIRGRQNILKLRSEKQKRTETCFEAIKSDMGIRRNIRFVCYQNDESDQANYTMGIFRPVIVYSNSKNVDLIMRHEMQHIKNCDTLWRVLSFIACVIHWFNPFSWWLWKELAYISERVCDESVTKDLETNDRKRYARLLVEVSSEKKTGFLASVSSEGGKRLKTRVENVLNINKKVWKRSAGICLTVAITLLSSVTVLAYADVQYVHQESDMTADEITDMISDSDFVLMFGIDSESLWQAEEYEIMYDIQFTGENGVLYCVDEDNIYTEMTCSHTYETGTLVEHEKNTSGGCRVAVYSARRCPECMAYVIMEEIRNTAYESCSH